LYCIIPNWAGVADLKIFRSMQRHIKLAEDHTGPSGSADNVWICAPIATKMHVDAYVMRSNQAIQKNEADLIGLIIII